MTHQTVDSRPVARAVIPAVRFPRPPRLAGAAGALVLAVAACSEGQGVAQGGPSVTPPECVSGSTYYVDPDAGADGNDGLSRESAWRTLDRANRQTFGPGQCLLFKQGSTSRGQLTLDHLDSGEPGAPLIVDTYVAEAGAGASPAGPGSDTPWGEEPVSGGPGGGGPAPGASCEGEALATIHQTVTAGGELTGHGIVLHSAEHVVLRHLHLVGPGIRDDGYDQGAQECVDQGGCGLLIFTDGSLGRRSGVVARCVVAEGWDRAGFQVASNSPSKVGYSDVRFEDCAALRNGMAGFASNGEFSDSATLYAHADLRITRSVAYRNPGRASDTTRHSGNGIMLSDVDGAWVVDSRAYENGGSSNWPGGGPVGIWAWDATNVTFEGNWAYDNRSGLAGVDGGGFDFDGGVTHSVMRGNHSWGNDGPGLMIYHFPDARGETAYNEIRNNVSTDDGRTNGAGLLLGAGVDNVDRVHSNVFADNTIEGMHGPGVALLGPLGRDNQFVGNDFAGVAGAPTLRSEFDLSPDHVVFLENDYPSGFTAEWGDESYASWVDWQVATGQESGR